MLKKTLIAIALLFWPLASLLSAEKGSPTFLIMGELAISSGIVNYSSINDKLNLSYFEEGTSDNYSFGIKGALIYDRVMIDISTTLSPDKQVGYVGTTASFYRLSSAVRIGPPLPAGRKSIFFPYLGIGLEYLLIKIDMLRYLPFSSAGFFFNKNDYSIYNIAFLYGLAYDWPLIQDKNWLLPIDLLIGIDAGGMISKPHRHWFVNGKPESNDNAPEFDLRDFMVIVHLDIGLLKRK